MPDALALPAAIGGWAEAPPAAPSPRGPTTAGMLHGCTSRVTWISRPGLGRLQLDPSAWLITALSGAMSRGRRPRQPVTTASQAPVTPGPSKPHVSMRTSTRQEWNPPDVLLLLLLLR